MRVNFKGNQKLARGCGAGAPEKVARRLRFRYKSVSFSNIKTVFNFSLRMMIRKLFSDLTAAS
jgi:hypothetical protein